MTTATATRPLDAISFSVSDEDARLIGLIADRALELYRRFEIIAPERMGVQMDLTACHANGCPLRLAELLAADNFNFVHDVIGIWRHLNRETGRLEDLFSPRFRQRGTE